MMTHNGISVSFNCKYTLQITVQFHFLKQHKQNQKTSADAAVFIGYSFGNVHKRDFLRQFSCTFPENVRISHTASVV